MNYTQTKAILNANVDAGEIKKHEANRMVRDANKAAFNDLSDDDRLAVEGLQVAIVGRVKGTSTRAQLSDDGALEVVAALAHLLNELEAK